MTGIFYQMKGGLVWPVLAITGSFELNACIYDRCTKLVYPEDFDIQSALDLQPCTLEANYFIYYGLSHQKLMNSSPFINELVDWKQQWLSFVELIMDYCRLRIARKY